MHKQQGWPQDWEYSQAKLIQTLGRAHKEWTEAGVSASRVTTLRCLQEKGYQATSEPETTSEASLPGLWRKITQWSKVLFSDESKFCISFGNQGPRVWRKSGEAQIPCCLKSSVKFPQSVMIWAAMSSAGVGPLCFLKSTVNAAIYQEILEHFMLPSADKLYGDADLIFQQDLAPAHTPKVPKAGSMTMVLLCLIASKLAWHEPHRESMGYCQEEDERHQTQQCWWAEGHCQRNWASIPPQQCHKLINSMPRRIEAVIKAKGAPTKYWVHIQ